MHRTLGALHRRSEKAGDHGRGGRWAGRWQGFRALLHDNEQLSDDTESIGLKSLLKSV